MLAPGKYLVYDAFDPTNSYTVEITSFVYDQNGKLDYFVTDYGNTFNWAWVFSIQKIDY